MRILPVRWISAWAHGMGWLSFYLLKKRREITLENLDLVYGDSLTRGEKIKFAKKSFQHISLSIAELFLMERFAQNVSEHVTISGREHVKQALEKGNGIIYVVAHLGSWECHEFVAELNQHPWSVIVKDIKNPYVNKRIDQLRRSSSIVPIPKQNSAKSALQELKKNHVVSILIDQWAGPDGIWIEFFGKETSTTSIPARLAKRTGAAIITGRCLRKGYGKYEIVMESAMDLNFEDPQFELDVTQRLNRWLENSIKQSPEQWFWGHRRWKDKPHTLREVSNLSHS